MAGISGAGSWMLAQGRHWVSSATQAAQQLPVVQDKEDLENLPDAAAPGLQASCAEDDPTQVWGDEGLEYRAPLQEVMRAVTGVAGPGTGGSKRGPRGVLQLSRSQPCVVSQTAACGTDALGSAAAAAAVATVSTSITAATTTSSASSTQLQPRPHRRLLGLAQAPTPHHSSLRSAPTLMDADPSPRATSPPLPILSPSNQDPTLPAEYALTPATPPPQASAPPPEQLLQELIRSRRRSHSCVVDSGLGLDPIMESSSESGDGGAKVTTGVDFEASAPPLSPSPSPSPPRTPLSGSVVLLDGEPMTVGYREDIRAYDIYTITKPTEDHPDYTPVLGLARLPISDDDTESSEGEDVVATMQSRGTPWDSTPTYAGTYPAAALPQGVGAHGESCSGAHRRYKRKTEVAHRFERKRSRVDSRSSAGSVKEVQPISVTSTLVSSSSPSSSPSSGQQEQQHQHHVEGDSSSALGHPTATFDGDFSHSSSSSVRSDEDPAAVKKCDKCCNGECESASCPHLCFRCSAFLKKGRAVLAGDEQEVVYLSKVWDEEEDDYDGGDGDDEDEETSTVVPDNWDEEESQEGGHVYEFNDSDSDIEVLAQSESWVDLSNQPVSGSPDRVTPLPFGNGEEYLRLLREAQRESNQSSARVSLASSRRDTPRDSPKSPPNSPNTELTTDPEEPQLKGVYINYYNKEGDFIRVEKNTETDWIWDWSSRPDQAPPKEWRFSHPRKGACARGYHGASIRRVMVGNSSLFSRDVLYTLLITNVLSLIIGTGIGIWLSKRSGTVTVSTLPIN